LRQSEEILLLSWIGEHSCLDEMLSLFRDGTNCIKGSRRGYEVENWVLRAPPPSGNENEEYKWYWMSGISLDEVSLVKIFDSEGLKHGSSVGSGAPHSAITIERTEDEPPRQSIEVKGWVFW
jgi:hypothetical protein